MDRIYTNNNSFLIRGRVKMGKNGACYGKDWCRIVTWCDRVNLVKRSILYNRNT